jgi:hypothetical protein
VFIVPDDISAEESNEDVGDDDNISVTSHRSHLTVSSTISIISKEKERQRRRINGMKDTRKTTRPKNTSPSSTALSIGASTSRSASPGEVRGPDASAAPVPEARGPDASAAAPVLVPALGPNDKPFPIEEDVIARQLDVPIATFIREVEEEALKAGHENNGFLSFRNGFLPMLYPEQELPEKFKAWDDMGKNLTTMVSDLTLRHFVETELPVLSAT